MGLTLRSVSYTHLDVYKRQAIGVCDGIAMGHIGMKYSLPSRELIADSVETMVTAHAFDLSLIHI